MAGTELRIKRGIAVIVIELVAPVSQRNFSGSSIKTRLSGQACFESEYQITKFPVWHCINMASTDEVNGNSLPESAFFRSF